MAEEEQQEQQPRICEFYYLPRGCIKQDSCDFEHPTAPNGEVTNKICDFILKARGCVKGEECNFAHPDFDTNPWLKRKLAEVISTNNGVCQYYLTARGCIKGNQCDFLHPHQQNRGFNGGRVCQYYSTPRGCVKGDKCDFDHMQGGMRGMGADRKRVTARGVVSANGQLMKPSVCSFFSTEKGCVKGELCDFIHQKSKPCDFYSSEKGCRKGNYCEFVHESGNTDQEE